MKKVAGIALVALALASGSAEAVQRRAHVIWTGAATDTTAEGMADSSGVFYTGDLQRMQLFIKPNKPCRLAIQIRSHGDSLVGSGTPAMTDSTKSYSWPWRSFNTLAGHLNDKADSTAWIEIQGAAATPGTSVTASEDEFVMEFNADNVATTSKKWVGPRGKTIDLVKVDSGIPYWGPNTSVRVRVLTSTAQGVVTLTGSLQGVSY
jgi:hypothetical protein